jgi:ABC-2 type transport system permease protein
VITGVLYVVQQSLVLSSSRAGSRVTAPLLPATLPTTWPGRALAAIALGNVHDTAMYLTATLAVSACLLAVAVILAARLMTGGAGVYQEVGQKRKRTGVDTHSGALGLGPITVVSPDRQPSQPAWVTLLGKEWILLRRDASRLAAMMYPLFIIGFYLTRAFETGPPSSTGGASDHLSGLISGSMYWILTLTIILLLNAVTPSIVNREGKSLYLLSVAPVEAREILVAKWAICAAPILVLVEGLLIVGALAERISLDRATIAAIGLAIMVCTLVVMVISINLRWPHLDVSSPWKQSSITASFIDLVAKVLVAVPSCGLLILAFSLWDSWPLYSLVAVICFLGLTGAVASSSYRSSTHRLTNLMVGE